MIGISAAVERARWAVWEDVDVNISPRTYSCRIAESAAIPVVLPPSAPGADSPGELVDLLDALLLSGGGDLDPASYGAPADPRTENARAERDRFELELAREALARDIPVLGICRGMELLNVAHGGTLTQHLSDTEVHLHTPGRFSDHEVRLEPGSLAALTVGRERLSVRSHHHQGVGRLGEGLVASGWAEPGGAIEAIEAPGRRWALGVLWHAEEERGGPVLDAFAAAAREEAVAA